MAGQQNSGRSRREGGRYLEESKKARLCLVDNDLDAYLNT